MKSLIVCSILCLFGVTLSAEPNEEHPQLGRYHLVVGRLDILDIADVSKLTTKEVTANTVFKIDTSTGEAWYAERTVKPITGHDNKVVYVPAVEWVLIIVR